MQITLMKQKNHVMSLLIKIIQKISLHTKSCGNLPFLTLKNYDTSGK